MLQLLLAAETNSMMLVIVVLNLNFLLEHKLFRNNIGIKRHAAAAVSVVLLQKACVSGRVAMGSTAGT